MFQICLHGIPAIITSFNNTVLPKQATGQGKLCLFASSADAQTTFPKRSIPEDQILPVKAFAETIHLFLRKKLFPGIGFLLQVIKLCIFRRVHHIQLLNERLGAITGFKLYMSFPSFSLFGRNQNNAVCTTRPINSGSRGIFQNFNAFYFRIIQIRRRTGNRKTIDHIKRFVTTLYRISTTNTDTHIRSGSSGRLFYLCTGTFPRKRLQYIRCRIRVDNVRFHRTDRSCQIAFLNHAITDNHDFIQQFRIFFYLNSQTCFISDRNFFRTIADIRNFQDSIFSDLNHKVSIQICYDTVCRTFHHDVRADYG